MCRTIGFQQLLGVDGVIDLRRRERGVAQQFLDGARSAARQRSSRMNPQRDAASRCPPIPAPQPRRRELDDARLRRHLSADEIGASPADRGRSRRSRYQRQHVLQHRHHPHLAHLPSTAVRRPPRLRTSRRFSPSASRCAEFSQQCAAAASRQRRVRDLRRRADQHRRRALSGEWLRQGARFRAHVPQRAHRPRPRARGSGRTIPGQRPHQRAARNASVCVAMNARTSASVSLKKAARLIFLPGARSERQTLAHTPIGFERLGRQPPFAAEVRRQR